MAISIKKSSAAVTVPVNNSLSEEVQSQIANNTKLDTTDYTAPVETKVEAAVEAKGKRTDDVVQLKFSKGKRAEAKAFYALYDVKMNAGFEMAYEFLKEEVNAGRVKLSKSGIQRIRSEGV